MLSFIVYDMPNKMYLDSGIFCVEFCRDYTVAVSAGGFSVHKLICKLNHQFTELL